VSEAIRGLSHRWDEDGNPILMREDHLVFLDGRRYPVWCHDCGGWSFLDEWGEDGGGGFSVCPACGDLGFPWDRISQGQCGERESVETLTQWAENHTVEWG